MTPLEKCENCGRIIGKLETALIHDGHVVCAQCKNALRPPQLQPVKSKFPSDRKPISEYQCPKCGSDNTQRAQMVYANGTKKVSLLSTIFMAGSDGGDIGIAPTTGTQQSVLASTLNPPVCPKAPRLFELATVSALGIIFLLVFVSTTASGGSDLAPIKILFFLLTILAGGAFYYYLKKYRIQSSQYPKLREFYETEMQKWESQFVCMRCGAVFENEPSAVASVV